jgi:hypothetical protein
MLKPPSNTSFNIQWGMGSRKKGLAKLDRSASALLKKAGKIAREIIVSWTNFGREKPQDEDAETEAEDQVEAEPLTPLHFNPREFNFPNDEPFLGLCPRCGERRMLTRWVKLVTTRNARPYCEECASAMKIPESVVPIAPELEGGKMLSPEALAYLKLHRLWLRGKCFEDRVLALFEQSDFELLDRTENGWTYSDSPTSLDVKDSRPDLLIKHKRSGIEFGIIIRFFKKLAPSDHRGLVMILEEYSKKKAQEYCRQFKLSCFVVVGRGVSPSRIEQMLLIPLDNVNPEGMQLQEISRYSHDLKQPMTFMELADRCGILSESPSDQVQQ